MAVTIITAKPTEIDDLNPSNAISQIRQFFTRDGPKFGFSGWELNNNALMLSYVRQA